MKKEIVIEGMMCQHCKKHVEEALNGLADTTASICPRAVFKRNKTFSLDIFNS